MLIRYNQSTCLFEGKGNKWGIVQRVGGQIYVKLPFKVDLVCIRDSRRFVRALESKIYVNHAYNKHISIAFEAKLKCDSMADRTKIILSLTERHE